MGCIYAEGAFYKEYGGIDTHRHAVHAYKITHIFNKSEYQGSRCVIYQFAVVVFGCVSLCAAVVLSLCLLALLHACVVLCTAAVREKIPEF